MDQHRSDIARQLALIAGGTSLVALGATADYGEREELRSPAIPVGEAFSIWLPIYLGNFALIWRHSQDVNRRDPLMRDLGWPLALALGGAGLWQRVFGLGSLPLDLTLIPVTWAAAGLAYHRLPPPESSLAPTWTVRVPVGLLFGWLTVAAAAGQSEELLDPANSDLDLDPERLAIAGLAAVGTIGSAITLGVDRSLAFPAAVAWGLGGVIVAQIEERPAVALAAGAALAAVGLATVGALLRRWRRSRRVR